MSIKHPLALQAANLAEQAEIKGVFPSVHKELMAGKELTKSSLAAIAKRHGLRINGTSVAAERVQMDLTDALKMKLAVVPCFVVVKRGVPLLVGWDKLEESL